MSLTWPFVTKWVQPREMLFTCSGRVVVSEVERGLLSKPSLLASLVGLFDG